MFVGLGYKLIEKERETTQLIDQLSLLEKANHDAIKNKDKICQELSNEIKLLEDQAHIYESSYENY